MARKLTARMGSYWLLLEASGESTWRLLLLGDSHHEAEITAVDEDQAKEQDPEFREPSKVTWNPAFVADSRFSL